MSDNETTTIIVDKNSFDYWRGRVDTILESISKKMDKVSDSIAAVTEWKAEFNNRVESAERRLQLHESLLSEQAKAIRDLSEVIQRVTMTVEQTSALLETIQARVHEPPATPKEENAPTFKWFTEKLGMPVLIAGIGFLLFTVLPSIIIVIYIVQHELGVHISVP